MYVVYIAILLVVLGMVAVEVVMQILVAKEYLWLDRYANKLRSTGKEIDYFDIEPYWKGDELLIRKEFENIRTLISPPASPFPNKLYLIGDKRVYIVTKPYFGVSRLRLNKYWVIEVISSQASKPIFLDQYVTL